MEGILEKFYPTTTNAFGAGTWHRHFFVLHDDILIFTELEQKTKILGKMHMKITKVTQDQPGQDELEIRMHSGLVDVRVRAASIKEKINWKNAMQASQKSVTSKSFVVEQEKSDKNAKAMAGRLTMGALP